MELTLVCVAALLLDRFVDTSTRCNIQVPLSRLASRIELFFYGPPRLDGRLRFLLGALTVAVLLIPVTLLTGIVSRLPYIGFVVDVGLLYLALGAAQLKTRVNTIADALQRGDLEQARGQVSGLVRRDTAPMMEEDISLATVEAILKGSCQFVLGPVFWFLVVGSPGVAVYCLGNGLAAQWGYPTPRYYQFGWVSARFATLLNWFPARLMGIAYGFWCDRKTAWHCWRTQSALWNNHNNGVLLAAGAGALNLQLGGCAYYYGCAVQRPCLGAGILPRAIDIRRASDLMTYSLGGYFGLIMLGEAVLN